MVRQREYAGNHAQNSVHKFASAGYALFSARQNRISKYQQIAVANSPDFILNGLDVFEGKKFYTNRCETIGTVP